MKIEDLVRYFTQGIEVTPESERTVGMEIETMFVNAWGEPITLDASQYIFHCMKNNGWGVEETKKQKSGDMLITKLRSKDGDMFSYELGRHNLELNVHPIIEKPSVSAYDSKLLKTAIGLLGEIYAIAKHRCAFWSSKDHVLPLFRSTMAWPEDLLVIPDERDAAFVQFDGREALNFLAKTASVQFMYTVKPIEAITALNNLNKCLNSFLFDGEGFPQEKWWLEYMRCSSAGYRPERYGGPREFRDIEDYCEKLTIHDVITPRGLVPFAQVENLDIPLYIRSIWWHFRLRRFGNNLCVEIRVLPRLKDEEFPNQMLKVECAMEGRAVGKIPTKREVFGVLLANSSPNSI